MTNDVHYQAPGRTTRLFNRLVAGLTGAGISVWGSRVLEVPGRRSGLPRRTPVNLLTVDGQDYLVAPRGEAEWVRNVRANDGRLVLILGKRREERRAAELLDVDKPAVLRPYLKRWKFEVGAFFEGVSADSTDAELIAAGPRHPVFALG
ncbi:nitroreductase/quinone reductase family protein [Acidiferrimicrobium sp. IK]|uniref:nitroreductase/quinone reductase family protein n=1 Tax=Acidiferrimicrobium sp. IK TaxID=2871700 RepID=UPI0021CB61FE|nr:nitroreductase/quinone reductase family protein [Acidiferrimicrobium sp. IK]MCU4183156.1 nitroreductase/quinone reductase family protein [Acidiferrimicrobium sp. IK]